MRKSVLIIGLLIMILSGLAIATASDSVTPTPPPVGRRANLGTGDEMATAEMTEEVTTQAGEACEYYYFFDDPEPLSCPEGPVDSGEAAFQRFEYGYMIWTESNDHVYVMHDTEGSPSWLMTPDPFVAGAPERDLSWSEVAPPQTSQPRFGFGILWRGDDELRHRIGWAVHQWENVYTARTQVAEDGTIYLEEPGGGVFVLPPEGDWKLYRGR